MDKIKFLELVKQKYPSVDIDDFNNKIEIYKDFLNEKNKVMNLTRLNDEQKIYEKYFYESLIPFFDIDLKNKKILDIGSGSGIPGIVLKILEPTIDLTIIEAITKRTLFMSELVTKLNLSNVTILNKRAEDIQNQHLEHFDIITSRAVSNLGALLEISCQYAKIGAMIIEPKSLNYKDELNKVNEKKYEYGLKLLKIEIIDDNAILYYIKDKKSSKIFPREWKEIVKDYK